MQRKLFYSLALVAIALVCVGDLHARGGRGGGGRSVGGGGARSPSMSRPSPSISRPSTRPSTPSVSRPSVSRPASPSISRPSVQPSRPSTGVGTRPSTGVGTRPSTGVGGSRPDIGNLPANNRPSQGQLQDFLDLPGQQPSRPDVGQRPATGERPNIGERPSVGERPNVGDRPNISDNARDRWKDHPDRPFDKDYWNRPGHNHAHWHWQGQWGGRPPGYWWRPCSWAAFGTWFAWSWPKEYYYDYGNTIVYQDNSVYYGEKEVCSAEAYYQQAEAIAEGIPKDADPEKVEWLPLGVFALAQEGVAESGMILQLAVSKEGIVAGTYYNETSGTERPVEGMVDQKTQRVAWRFADDGPQQELVMETGIYNLTKDEAKCLVHFGADNTQTWTMIRLPAPDDAATDGGASQ